MKYKAIIFDLDGTLLNTLEDLADAVNYAMKTLGFPERSVSEVNSFIGNGNRKLMERSVPAGTDTETVETSLSKFHEYYSTHYTVKTRVYDGIMPLLEELKNKGIKLAVVSNKVDYATQDLCRIFFDDIFEFVTGDVDGIPRKPAPDPVFKAMEAMGVQAGESLYIGDSEVDIQTASNAGIDCISAGWGFRSPKVLEAAGASVIISEPCELLKYI